MRHGELQEFPYRDGPEARLELPVRRRDVGEEDIAVRIWMERSDANLELPVRFEEATCLDLHRMRAQGADPARIEVEAEIQERKCYRDDPRSAEFECCDESVLGHGPKLRITETGHSGRDISRVWPLPESHTRLYMSEAVKNQRAAPEGGPRQ